MGRSGRKYQLGAGKTGSAGEKMGRVKTFCRKWFWARNAKRLMQIFEDFRQTGKNSFAFSGNGDRIFEILNYIVESKISVQKIERMEPSLESLFLEVAKQ